MNWHASLDNVSWAGFVMELPRAGDRSIVWDIDRPAKRSGTVNGMRYDITTRGLLCEEDRKAGLNQVPMPGQIVRIVTLNPKGTIIRSQWNVADCVEEQGQIHCYLGVIEEDEKRTL